MAISHSIKRQENAPVNTIKESELTGKVADLPGYSGLALFCQGGDDKIKKCFCGEFVKK